METFIEIAIPEHKKLTEYGMINAKHGESGKPTAKLGRQVPTIEYSTWNNVKMLARKLNISINENWKNDYNTFLAYVGRRPTEKHWLVRVDTRIGYEIGNVKWNDKREWLHKNRNKKKTRVGSYSVRTPEYNCWIQIKQRCRNPKNPAYKDYGGRGINICDEWFNNYEIFFNYVGKKPTPKHSIDRYPNNDGNYEPKNVRWATAVEQANNTRKSKWVTIKIKGD